MTARTEFLVLENENIPCFYELSWDAQNLAIIVRISKDFLEKCREFTDKLDKNFVAEGLINRFEFSGFDGDIFGGNFGFEGAFVKQEQTDGFIVFKVSIPVLEKQLEKKCPLCSGDGKGFFNECLKCKGKGNLPEPCERCEGTGRDQELDLSCLECGGRGVKIWFDWKPFYVISATFDVFFGLMFFGQERAKITSNKNSQLILIDTVINKDGCGIEGAYSIPLAQWLVIFEEGTEITECSCAMKDAWRQMYGKIDRYDQMNTWARVDHKNGWLNISCPGDRCGLYPSNSSYPVLGQGYKFSCHNVDTPMQVITFLVCLAMLQDKARKEIEIY